MNSNPRQTTDPEEAGALSHPNVEHSHPWVRTRRPQPRALTLRGAEVHGLRRGPHALGVARLDLEVVGGVQRQLLDLVGEPVPHHGLDHPIVILGVDVRAVVNDVTCHRSAAVSLIGPGQTWPPLGPLTRDLPVGLGGRLPVDDDGARLVLLAHHGHVFGRGAGD